jgi:asparagine synthase (glutamine-hydrolysing)
MCGIAGIIAYADGRAPRRSELEAMIKKLRHRGPDGFGYYESGPVGLAHARLSIIDLATGDQPITNEDGTIWTVFNGEIFNYLELRAALVKAGHVFKTQSDTETIVHAYEEYGDDFVQHLNGQFAIALWDVRRRRLLLIRDRAGIRPLFWRKDGQRLLFASEAKAIFAGSSTAPTLDIEGLGEIFTFWAPVGERTVFEGVHSLPPGCMLSIENGRETITRYWQWDFPAADECSRLSFDEAAEELRSLLTDAVRLQLRADVPVGAYLSGGLDSSILVSLIRQRSDVPLRTFSVGFEDSEFDESEYQRTMVQHLRTDHTEIRCSKQDIGAAFGRLIYHTETPVLRTAPVPLMLLSRHVRDSGFKVVLTGEGADEVFGGYDLFKEAQIRRFWARQPSSSWRPSLLRRLYPYLRHSPVGTSFSQSFFGQSLTDTDSPFYGHLQRWATTRRLFAFLSPDVKARIEKSEPVERLRELLPAGISRWSGLSRDQYIEANTLLMGYLLSSQGDRVAMANSVEGRVPFLDHRVIEFANRLPARYKLRALTEKAVLRAATRDLLPASILNRVKQPYRAPDSQSFFVDSRPSEVMADVLDATRLRDAGYFDPTAVARLIEKCRTGRAIGFSDNMAFMSVLSTMMVHDAFVRNRQVSSDSIASISTQSGSGVP